MRKILRVVFGTSGFLGLLVAGIFLVTLRGDDKLAFGLDELMCALFLGWAIVMGLLYALCLVGSM